MFCLEHIDQQLVGILAVYLGYNEVMVGEEVLVGGMRSGMMRGEEGEQGRRPSLEGGEGGQARWSGHVQCILLTAEAEL